MPTPIFVCGAECALVGTGTTGVGVEHWVSTGGTTTVVTSGPSPMRSTRCFRHNPAAAQSYLSHTFAAAIGSPATGVARFAWYFTTLPDTDCDMFTLTPSVGTSCGISFVQATGQIRAFADGAAGAANSTGFTVSTGNWYVVDVEAVFNTTRTVDWQVNGSGQAQATVGGKTASTITTFTEGTSVNLSGDWYTDDIIVSGTAADYPIGAGTVAGLYPNGDGTHVYNAAADFGKAGTALTALNATPASETTSWQSLKNPLSLTVDTTKFVSDQAGASTEYLEWTFDDLPAGVTTVNGLMVVTCNHAAAATACVATGRLNDNGTTNDIYNLADFSETTIVTAVKTYATAPSTAAAWTKTRIDALKFQWGLSTDVNPDPILDGVCFEVDYVAAVPYDGLPPIAIIAPSVAAQRASRW